MLQTGAGPVRAAICAGPVRAAADSVGSYELCSTVLEYLFLLVPPFPFVPRSFLPPLLRGSLRSKGRDLMQTSHLELCVSESLTVCLMSDFESLCLFLCVAGGSLCDDG